MLLALALGSGFALMLPVLTKGSGLDPQTMVQLMNREKAVVIDVCEPDEFARGHVIGSKNLPLGQLEEKLGQVVKNKSAQVIKVCQVGARSARAAAAARKQAPVVAHNLLVAMGQLNGEAKYDGYGSCPLTVERGKIVLAEFTYGGKLSPSFPSWLIDGTKPSALAWYLKERILPPIYWEAMLKGREWMAQPEMVG